jgi:membrane protein required for colicin V production
VASVDLVVLTILGMAVARGLFRGLVREAFSLAALAAAVFVVWRFEARAAAAIAAFAGEAIPEVAARAAAVVGLAVSTFVAATLLQRLVRRSVDAVGLGLLDRLAGGAAGAVEGALVVWLLVSGARFLLGPDHALLTGARSVEIVEIAEARLSPAPVARDVAAPPSAH